MEFMDPSMCFMVAGRGLMGSLATLLNISHNALDTLMDLQNDTAERIGAGSVVFRVVS